MLVGTPTLLTISIPTLFDINKIKKQYFDILNGHGRATVMSMSMIGLIIFILVSLLLGRPQKPSYQGPFG